MLDAVLFLARLGLAALLSLAGLAKLADPDSRQSMAAFGVPGALVPVVAWGVPVAELTCAAALVTSRWAWWGAMGASGLLLVFAAALLANLVLGRQSDCACFGQLHSQPANWLMVARNLALAALSVFLAVEHPPHAHAAVGPLRAAMAFLDRLPIWVFALVWLWLIGWALLSRALANEGRGVKPPAGAGGKPDRSEATTADGALNPLPSRVMLPVGAPAPRFVLDDLDGHPVALDDLARGGRTFILVFVRPGCDACDALLSQLSEWLAPPVEGPVIVIISKPPVEGNREKAAGLGLARVLVQRDFEVADAYGVDTLPSAIAVAGGHVASEIAMGGSDIRTLVGRIADTRPSARADS